MKFPEQVNQVVKESVSENLDCIEDAVDAAEKAIKKLPDFRDMIPSLVRHAIENLVCDARYNHNLVIKSDVMKNPGLPKVIVGNSRTLSDIGKSVYDTCVAGMSLRSVTVGMLGDIIKNLDSQIDGLSSSRAFYAWCEKKTKGMPADKPLPTVIPEEDLRKALAKILNDKSWG